MLVSLWRVCACALARLLLAASLALCLGLPAHAQSGPQPEFQGASASGGDWKCGSFSQSGYPSPTAAINAVVSYTHSCPYLVSIHTDSCTGANRTISGSCSYAGRKNAEGGGDNVGGSASWTFACPSGTSDAGGGQCSCPSGQTWSQTLRSCQRCPAGQLWNEALGSCRPQIVEDHTQNPPPGQCGEGNPIYPARGNKRETVDLSVGIGWLRTALTYDNSGALPTTTMVEGEALKPQPAFGDYWFGTLHRRLVIDDGQRAARASRGDGRVVSFSGNGAGVFSPQPEVNDRLLSVAGGYRFIDAAAQSIESYDSSGALTRIDRAGGQGLTFAYSSAATPPAIAPGPGYLLSVTDTFGRSVGFAYNAIGLVNQITDASGLGVAVLYSNDNLVEIQWQDSARRHFLYENAALRWALTGVVDERNLRKSTFGYDSQGRAISTEHAGGVNKYSVTYASPPAVVVTDTFDAGANVFRRTRSWQVPSAPVLSTPRGTTVNLGVSLVANQPLTVSRSQPAGSGCAASTSSMTYDATGNVAIEDDFNGNRQCRAHDLARNLTTVRVQGLAVTQACPAVTATGATLPTGSRKLTTQWHPDWRLETKVAEPGRITTYVYNGQSDPFNSNAIAACAPSTALLPDGKPIAVLCKRVEQATTDASGSQGMSAALQAGVANRVQQWTYNQYGQVLTARDPVNNTTTYTYHPATTADVTLGDVSSMTNAKGHVTQYTRYNKYGQLLRSVDANAVVTDYTYDLRQKLTGVSVGGQATGYTYDAAGQLTRVTLPDTSWVGYEYDGAQRQIAVLDSRGNRIDYTLDNAGLRTAETVRDPSGSLARLLSRSIDALGRVQQTTGQGVAQ
jgi:YD repeat-containing protein